jgi:MYXO-CTERM domain-containing protein
MLTKRRCSPKLVAAAFLALAAVTPAFGFGGHTPAPMPPIGPGNPATPPGAGGGPETPGTEPIPPVLLQPTPGEILPPPVSDTGGVPSTPPPDAGGPASAPEPTTMVMGLLGAGLAAAYARRRRQSI